MALRVLTDFEHAAAEKVRVVESEKRVCFAAPLGDSPRGMWFHFKVAGGDGQPVTFLLTNREQMLGRGDYRRAVPVYRRPGGHWQRVDSQQCLTDESPGPEGAALAALVAVATGATRALSATGRGSRAVNGIFAFRVPCGPEETEIAYCYPYTLEMVDQTIGRWAADRNVTVLTLCRSEHGRPLRVVRIGAPGRGKKVIWVLARQHSGEVPGSYAAEGLIEAALGPSAWAASLRRRAVLFVCPAVDVDGVAEGLYGKDRAPIDFNRDWCANPIRPEIRALRKAMDASRSACGGPAGRMLAIVDLHAPGPGAVSFPVSPHPAWAGLGAWQQVWRLGKLIERFAGDRSPIRWANAYADHIDWSPPMSSCRPTSSFHAAGNLADYAMSLELTYNWQVNGSLVTPADWRRMGQSAARAFEVIARQARPLGRVRPPDPPYYLSPSFGWLNVPRQCNARISDERISIQAEGPQAYAAVLFGNTIPVGRGRFAAHAQVYRTSHGKCPLHRLIFFFKDGVFTGEVFEQSSDLGGQDEIHWRGPIKRKYPADSARLGLAVRNWPGTLTITRPSAEE